jgi:serine/threonine protein kinase
MEYVDSVSVARLLARGAAGLFVPTPVCAFITHEVARALAYAHGAGVLHRDVSASNVLVSAAGDVKLTDFGLADADGRLSATAPGQVLGKWTYLSPHRRLGGPATAADDLYAVGVLLERLLSAADPRERARPNGRALQSLHRRLVDENHRPRTTQALELVTLLAATDIANREAVAHFLRLPPPRRAAGRPVIPEDSGAATAGGRSAPTRRRR